MMTLTETVTERSMTNVDPPPPRRELPVSTVQLAAVTADAVVSGLSKSPYMLGIVVLNMIGIVAAVYFLNLLISGQQAHLKALLTLQEAQHEKILAMHQKEFDALLEMGNRLSAVPPPSPIAPGSPILNQPTLPPRR